MEDLKIYIVMDANKFKNLCKEKLGDKITVDDFIVLDSINDERIHLVPKYSVFIQKHYIHSIPQDRADFDIYIKLKDRWVQKNFVKIKHEDIKELVSNNTIVDLEKVYKKI